MKSFIKKYKTALIIVTAILVVISINTILWSFGVIVDIKSLIMALVFSGGFVIVMSVTSYVFGVIDNNRNKESYGKKKDTQFGHDNN